MKMTMMFNCVVLLAGNEFDKVPRIGVTEHEIKVLQSIHGHGAVQNIVEAGEKMMPSGRELLCHLARSYSLKRVEKVFDVSLHEYPDWLEQELMSAEAKQEVRIEQAIAPVSVALPVAAQAQQPVAAETADIIE